MLDLEIVEVKPIKKPDCPHFDGEYDIKKDHLRLSAQFLAVEKFMLDYRWHTLQEISGALGFPEASVSARIRDLRKMRFGAYKVDTARSDPDSGLYLYRIIRPEEPPRLTAFLWEIAKKYGLECHSHEGEYLVG